MSHDRSIYNLKVDQVKDVVAEQEEQRQYEALDKMIRNHQSQETKHKKYLEL